MTDAALPEALAKFRAGDFSGAKALLDGALARNPENSDAHHLMALVERAHGNADSALVRFDFALALNPKSAPAHLNRASLLLEMGRAEAALRSYEFAIALKPENPLAWSGRAAAFDALDRPEEAFASYEQAQALNPDDLSIANDRAVALTTLRRYDEAIAIFDAVLKRAPEFDKARKNRAAARYNKGVALMRAGEYPEGFALFEERRAAGAVTGPEFGRGKPRWKGEKLDGLLHIWAEQGVGDVVLFSSLLPRVRALAPRIALECDVRLAPLFKRAFPWLEAIEDIAARAPIDAAAQISLPSLGHALRIARDDLDGKPFLIADADRVARLRERYANGRTVIGIAWNSKNAAFGAQKSSSLLEWGALLREPYTFVNLQYGGVADAIAEANRTFGCNILIDPEIDQMSDLDGFAAQIAACDAIVSVSNTTVHLAGALGVRCNVLVPPERRLLWYWGVSGETTPWYESLRLIEHRDGWAEQVARAAASLP